MDDLMFLASILDKMGVDLDKCHVIASASEIYFEAEGLPPHCYNFVIRLSASANLEFFTNQAPWKERSYLCLANPESDPVSWVQEKVRENS